MEKSPKLVLKKTRLRVPKRTFLLWTKKTKNKHYNIMKKKSRSARSDDDDNCVARCYVLWRPAAWKNKIEVSIRIDKNAVRIDIIAIRIDKSDVRIDKIAVRIDIIELRIPAWLIVYSVCVVKSALKSTFLWVLKRTD